MKKGITALIGLFALACGIGVNATTSSPRATGKTLYVSPTGNDKNSGTKDSPYDFYTAKNNVEPGTTILLEAGTYKYDTRILILDFESGENGAPITVKPIDETSRVIFDFSEMIFAGTNRGIQINGDWWHFYGIEVMGAGDNGMYIAGSNNIIENCQFYKNRDTGLQLGRASGSHNNINQWPSNNLIKNCTSFYNYDAETLGENADGFASKLTVGYGNVFDGCIAYRNSDDGWDLFAKEDSGNIGTVMLYNCFSFENGFLPESYEVTGGEITFNTANGDGIGFKLGGGVMEGDVIIENCVAFNNKLHGFSDNSNPGVIKMKNCTAVNNCIGLNADGTVGLRGILGGENKSNNFDMARDTNSYNSYYGLLSYINNQTGFNATGNSSYNGDKFRGSVAHSIFQTDYDEKELYVAATDYVDASVYAGDTLPQLTTSFTGISDDSFESLASINAINDKLYSIHKLLRNADGSINLGKLLKLKDEKLLTFADGNPVGADLSKSSFDEYTHHVTSDFSNVKTEGELELYMAYDNLDLATNLDAVFQTFEIAAFINNCEVTWESSNPDVIEIDTTEKISKSSATFIKALVKSPKEDTKVTLTATLQRGKYTTEKTFELVVKAREVSLGKLISSDKTESYILSRYQPFCEPTIKVTDGNSIDGTELNTELYTLEKVYEWADRRNGQYVRTDGIYSSVPGVFKVTTTATLKSDTTQTSSFIYYITIGKDEGGIDFLGGINTFKINSVGFNIAGNLDNPVGKIYAAVVDKETSIFKAEELLALSNVQVYSFNSNYISFDFEADNSVADGYKVYYLICDKVEKNFSGLYSKTINAETINTKQEFYDLAQGITPTDAMTVYNLTTDLDFQDFAWTDPEGPSAFKGTFNGNGHKISNVTVTTSIQKNGNLFYKMENATVMNVDFENIKITHSGSGAKLVGIVGAMNGGYIANVNMKNVTVVASDSSATAVGALVGQIIGGVNNINHITLVNDENQKLFAGNKYAGGIVGNIQMDTGMDEAKAYISYCYVVADFGDGTDAGGCIGGIVGRIKNDKDEYYLDVNNCYYKGTIKVKGNYNGGIVGSVESGKGLYNISNNFADVVFIYCSVGELVLDAKEIDTEYEYQAYAHKNCNPICGRATTLYSDILGRSNAGSWEEYYSDTILSIGMYFLYGSDFVPGKGFYSSFCGWDMENDWNVDAQGNVTLIMR